MFSDNLTLWAAAFYQCKGAGSMEKRLIEYFEFLFEVIWATIGYVQVFFFITIDIWL